jgi:2,3-bisphosphoglycerate-independent phosphoglycerate mutase
MANQKPLVLTILDGWGYSPASEGNAIALARKPTYDHLLATYPNTLIHTSGPYVGLPEGQMGNSEVGHMNMGAGRVIYMDVTRIDLLIASNEFFRNPALMNAMKKAEGHRLHLLGLCSDGGVHAQLSHLFALLRMAKEHGLSDVFVHCFMDGRDTPPESGAGFILELEKEMRQLGVGKIASVSVPGRSPLLDTAFHSPAAAADLSIRLRGRVNAPGLHLRCGSEFSARPVRPFAPALPGFLSPGFLWPLEGTFNAQSPLPSPNPKLSACLPASTPLQDLSILRDHCARPSSRR